MAARPLGSSLVIFRYIAMDFGSRAVGGVGFAYGAEAFDRLFVLPEPGINVADRIENGQIVRFHLENLLVLGNGVRQLVLLQIALCVGTRFFFVKTESEHECTPMCPRPAAAALNFSTQRSPLCSAYGNTASALSETARKPRYP